MTSTRLASVRLVALFMALGCASLPANTDPSSSSAVADTVEARRLFEENIDAIHKRDRARYLATYLHTSSLGRNGPAGLELGYEGWSARRDSTWPDTLIARNLGPADRTGRRVRNLLLYGYAERHHLEWRFRADFCEDSGRLEDCRHDRIWPASWRTRTVQIKREIP